jgi:hypothetical protein
MGLYLIECPECGQPYMWFSGNPDQNCEACRKGEPDPQYYYIEMPRENSLSGASVYTEKVDGLDADAICAVSEGNYLDALERLEGVRQISRQRFVDFMAERQKRQNFQRENILMRDVLEKIADVTSAFQPGRTVSYADYELRDMARKVLALLGDTNEN